MEMAFLQFIIDQTDALTAKQKCYRGLRCSCMRFTPHLRGSSIGQGSSVRERALLPTLGYSQANTWSRWSTRVALPIKSLAPADKAIAYESSLYRRLTK